MFATTRGQTIQIKLIRHREMDHPGIFFPYDTGIIQQIPDSQYSATLKCW